MRDKVRREKPSILESALHFPSTFCFKGIKEIRLTFFLNLLRHKSIHHSDFIDQETEGSRNSILVPILVL